MATSNKLRALNRLPYDFEDGLKVKGIDLSVPGGAAGVIYDTDNMSVQTVLDNAKPLSNYEALRAYNGRANQIRITDPGIAGFFYLDGTTSSLSEDNGGTIIIGTSDSDTGTAGNQYKRWKRHYDGPVNVKWFGAKGDGVTDDTAAIQRAIDSLAITGGELVFPVGKYKITSMLSKAFTDDISISIRGYGAEIDATAITSGNVIELGGSIVSSTTLGADIVLNADTYTVTSATGITAGRILLITSTDLWNPTRAYYYKGELSFVEKIVGTTMTNSNPMYDSYTAATTTVKLLNMPSIAVEGIEITCNADTTALQMLYVKHPVVRNCKVHGSRYAGIYVGYSLGGTIDSNFIYDIWNGVVTGTSYGISVGTGQGLKVVNNTIHNARHAIAGGSFEPSRELIYANNTCHNSTLENSVGSIDLHGVTENVVISGNTATSITCAGKNVVISNNVLNNTEAAVPGILIYQQVPADYFSIIGNRVNCSTSGGIGLYISPGVTGVAASNITISGNNFQTVSNAITLQPRTTAITGCSIGVLKIDNNLMTASGSASAAFVLNVNGAATYAIGQLMSSNNVYDSKLGSAYTHIAGNPVSLTSSTSDVFKANVLSGNVATFDGTDVRLTTPTFIGNTGGAGTARAARYNNTGRVLVSNPTFANMTFRAELSAAIEYVENGWYASTPSINNVAAGSRNISFYSGAGFAVANAAAAPTTGTWARGDVVWNTAPNAAGVPGWVCTTAGTPGTWKAMAALAA